MRISFFSLLIFSFLLSACGGDAPVWKGEVDLKDYTLSYNEAPLEFLLKVPGEGKEKKPFHLDLDLTYYVMIARNTLPLYVVIEDSRDFTFQEFNVKVPLKSEGQWLGEAQDYDTDYRLTYTALPKLNIAPGTYTMKIYANDDKEEKIYGLVKVITRLYEGNAEGENPSVPAKKGKTTTPSSSLKDSLKAPQPGTVRP